MSKLESFFEKRWHLIALLTPIIMLYLCVERHSSGYYKWVRWIVAGVSVLMAVTFGEMKRTILVVLFAAIAILFNPLFQFHFHRQTWVTIDVIVATVLLLVGLLVKTSAD
jgi:hypothetical protein